MTDAGNTTDLFRRVYAVAANSPDEAIQTAWKYATSAEGARELHGYPVALHADDIPARIKARYATVYRTVISITSLRPLRYGNRATPWTS